MDYVAASYGIAKALGGANRRIRDQWIRASQSNLEDKNRFFQTARGSALECAAMHDILTAFEWKRIVSMLTRLIQRSDGVA